MVQWLVRTTVIEVALTVRLRVYPLAFTLALNECVGRSGELVSRCCVHVFSFSKPRQPCLVRASGGRTGRSQ
jgi:hypothetical protein